MIEERRRVPCPQATRVVQLGHRRGQGAAKALPRAASRTSRMSLTKMSRALRTCPDGLSSMRAPRSSSMNEAATPWRSTSHVEPASSPSDSANASASAATPMCTPHRSWLTSFTFWPSPGSGPTTGLVRDSASSRGRAVASAASEPDTIMSRSPVAARATSPDTGASTTSTPDSPSLRRRRRVPCLTLRGTRRARGGEQKPDPAHRRRSDTRRGGSIEQARGGQAVSCARGRHRLPAQPARCPAACQHHANRRHQARRGRAMASSGCLRRRRRQRPVARLGLGRATAAPASEVDTTAMHQVFAIGECMVELVHR